MTRVAQWARRPSTVYLVLAAIVIAQIVGLYFALPGRISPSVNAVQPDSGIYICYGLHLFHDSPAVIAQKATAILSAYGYPDINCLEPDMSSTMLWLVFPRLLLSTLIGAASLLPWAIAMLLPNAAIFAGIAALWLKLVVGRGRPSRAFTWVVAVVPFLAFSIIVWPAAVLTEGLITLLGLLAVWLLTSSLNPLARLAPATAIGAAMLLTRPSWPVAATLWAVVLAPAILTRVREPTRAARIAIWTIAGIGGVVAALGTSRVIDFLTVPPGLKESQTYVPEGIPSTLDVLTGIVRRAMASTWQDILDAVSMGDVISVAVLLGGIGAVAYLLVRRQWALAAVTLVTWFVGVYSVGIISLEWRDESTHFRFLVSSIFTGIAAMAAVARRKVVSTDRPVSHG